MRNSEVLNYSVQHYCFVEKWSIWKIALKLEYKDVEWQSIIYDNGNDVWSTWIGLPYITRPFTFELCAIFIKVKEKIISANANLVQINEITLKISRINCEAIMHCLHWGSPYSKLSRNFILNRKYWFFSPFYDFHTLNFNLISILNAPYYFSCLHPS